MKDREEPGSPEAVPNWNLGGAQTALGLRKAEEKGWETTQQRKLLVLEKYGGNFANEQ